MPELGMGRNPSLYRQHWTRFLDQCEDRPFLMMANSHDPHRPFYGNDPAEWYEQDPPASVPSRTFAPEEVTVPGFLEDLPELRLEIAEYYNSVRRCDDTVGELLAELEARHLAENTLVLFLSDNGMAFPFAKTNCYLNSTQTPFFCRWPARIDPGREDLEHFVSGVDILPTFLEASGVEIPAGVQGASFLPLLDGGSQSGRDWVYTHFNQTAGKRNYPMRSVQNAQWLYIWNPWSDGERVFKNESQMGRSFNAMANAAQGDDAIAARIELFLHRVPEELYRLDVDPNARQNLIEDPNHHGDLQRCRHELLQAMERHGDPAREAFVHRGSEEHRQAFLRSFEATIGGQ